MDQDVSQAIFFYSRHPISADIILTKLRASRGDLAGLRPEQLFPYDQDHYGGVAANDELARGAVIGKGTRIADFCAGLGGPARYLAHQYGAQVMRIELTPARVAGAQKLTSLVGLQEAVRIVEGNVMAVPLDTERRCQSKFSGGPGCVSLGAWATRSAISIARRRSSVWS